MAKKVAEKYLRENDTKDRKGECCKTCKSWKKGKVPVTDARGEPVRDDKGDAKEVEAMLCKSKARFPVVDIIVPEPANGWCGWWEKGVANG